MDEAPLIALAEPNRLRIVELLGASPRAVGEIAQLLDLRQPQVTKHLQTLERAGLVIVHPLGRRRIYSLQRQPLRALRSWLEPFDVEDPSIDAIEQYRAAIEAEERRARTGSGDGAVGRELSFAIRVDAPPAEAFRWWTRPELMRRFWAPDHFSVAECEADPVPGGRMRIVMQEGDGARYDSAGSYLAVVEPTEVRFSLAALLPDGAPLLTSEQTVRLAPDGDGTAIVVGILVTQASEHAAPALAGMEPGWRQLLAKLAREVAADFQLPV